MVSNAHQICGENTNEWENDYNSGSEWAILPDYTDQVNLSPGSTDHTISYLVNH